MAMESTTGCVPVAALLFDSASRPGVQQVSALAAQHGDFAVIQHARDPHGQVELLREGLSFDLSGLVPAEPWPSPEPANVVALPDGFSAEGLEILQLSPGAHLAGAEHLLPVVRVAAAMIRQLAALPGVQAVAWLPARLLISPKWFSESVGVWLAGGPFPVLALTALSRSPTAFRSEGLRFLIGQEFVLMGRDGKLVEEESRIAVRLTDWLVAHGRVDAPREVVLAGVGPVWIEPQGPDLLMVNRV